MSGRNTQSQKTIFNEETRLDHLIDIRYGAIEDLTKDVEIINDIFQDLAVLVNTQSDVLDDIESNIEKAESNTKKGVEELVKAEGYLTSSRKKLFCILLTILLMVAIVVAMLVASIEYNN